MAISGISYALCTYYINVSEIDVSHVYPYADSLAKIQSLKDILLVFVSVCGTSLLLNLIVETNSKNALITDIIQNDVISAPEFYESMDIDKKEKMFHALEEHLYFKHNIQHTMFAEMRNKIIDMVCDYYYASCNYIVTCKIYDNYIEKEITRKVVLKSYDKNYTIRNFSIGNCSSKKIDGLESYELISFEINGEKVNLDNHVRSQTLGTSNLDEQNEYNVNIRYIYNRPLKISSTKETTVVVKCKTRTAIDDKSSTFRVVKPCKNFSLVYTLEQHEKYRLGVDAFGFLDDADESANNTSESNINITFNDWIFKYDGVVVMILDK